jgi:hypothetical protein
MDGYWQNGIQQGFGKQKLPQRESGFATYQGQILSGTWTGRGRVEYNDASIYEGQLAGGMRYALLYHFAGAGLNPSVCVCVLDGQSRRGHPRGGYRRDLHRPFF